MKRSYRVCGECAQALVEAGGVLQEGARILLGTPCARHGMIAATCVVEAKDGAISSLGNEAPSADDDDDVPAAFATSIAGLGPETELAARFVASWAHKSEGAKCDEFMVRHAIDAARLILSETKGR